MARSCLFCDRLVNSREHLFSDWILNELKDDAGRLNIKMGKHTNVWTPTPEVIIRCVCHTCNCGWMSDLEAANQPHMLPMMRGEKEICLSPSQQKLLTRWAILKTVILDGADRKRSPFFTPEERTSLRPPRMSNLVGTAVWIGRLAIRSFHAGGTEIAGEIDDVPEAYRGNVTTIIVGHLIIQVLTAHVAVKYASAKLRYTCKPGAWDVNLLEIWPIFSEVVWPPKFSFPLRGENSIGLLLTRFSIGVDLNA